MSDGIASVAAIAALISAGFVWLQVREAKRQTDVQREIMQAAAQPYVWADLRVQEANGWFVEFVVGNSGPTVATDVRVLVDPPFPGTPTDSRYVEVMHERLRSGLSSIPPGRTYAWSIGPSPELVNREGDLAHRVHISFEGPFGPVQESEYIIDIADFRETVAYKRGTLHDVAKSIEALSKRLATE